MSSAHSSRSSPTYFLTGDNLLGVARPSRSTAIVAIGQTMVIITGGIDLSVGSVLAFSGITTGDVAGRWLAARAGVAVGILVGTASASSTVC